MQRRVDTVLNAQIGEQLGHEGLALGEGNQAAKFVILATDEMAFVIELVGGVRSDSGIRIYSIIKT